MRTNDSNIVKTILFFQFVFIIVKFTAYLRPQRYDFFLKIPNVFVKKDNFSADLVEFSENRASILKEIGAKF